MADETDQPNSPLATTITDSCFTKDNQHGYHLIIHLMNGTINLLNRTTSDSLVNPFNTLRITMLSEKILRVADLLIHKEKSMRLSSA